MMNEYSIESVVGEHGSNVSENHITFADPEERRVFLAALGSFWYVHRLDDGNKSVYNIRLCQQ